MPPFDPRKLYLLHKTRKARMAVAKAGNIDVSGIAPSHPDEIHLLPIPPSLAQLLQQNAPTDDNPVSQSDSATPRQSPTPTPTRERETPKDTDTVSRAEFEAFKKEVDAKIDLRNAEMVTMRMRVAAMEADIASIRRNMTRVRTFAIASMIFMTVWTLTLKFLF